MKTNRLLHAYSAAWVPMIGVLLLGLLVFTRSASSTGQELVLIELPSNSTVKRVQQIYTSQIGVREKQPNSGPAVEEYLRYVGLLKGNPWCAAFVCWVLGKAGVENPGTGWSPGLFPVNKVIWVKAESEKRKTESGKVPGTGDVFGIYFQEKKRIAHVGFVDQWDGTWVVTVEGNTNESGGREGDGVYRKRRLVRSIYRVARYIN